MMLDSLNEELGLATFKAGEGEQHCGGKRKRRYMKENVSYTPEKRLEILDKYSKEISNYKGKVERYMNMFNGYSFEDMLNNIEGVEKFIKVGEGLESEASKASKFLWDVADDYSEEENYAGYNKALVVEGEYSKFEKVLYKLHDAMSDILRIIEKLQEDLKEN